MRIAFVSPRYDPTVAGGAELHLRQFAEHMTARGHAVRVLTTCARSLFTWANELPAGTTTVHGVPVERFPVTIPTDESAKERLQRCIDADLTPTRSMEDAWLHSMGYSHPLLERIDEIADEVDGFFFAPYLVATTVYGARVRPRQSVIMPCFHDEPYLRFGAIRETVRGVAGLVANTAAEREVGRRVLGTLPPTHLVGAGFDSPVAPDEAGFRERNHLQGDLIVYAGRTDGSKNFPLLAAYTSIYNDSLARRGPLDLVVLGGDHHDHHGRRHAPDAAPTRIHHLGFVSDADKLNAMASAVALVNLSVRESLSYVVMEAWSCGIPVIVHADCEVTRAHCEVSGGGLWIRSAEEFAVALDRLRADPGLRTALGAAGKQYVTTEYSWPVVLDRLEAALNALIPAQPRVGVAG